MKVLLIPLAIVALLASCTEAPVSPAVTPRPYSDSTKPYFIKINLYACTTQPVLYADIDVKGEPLGRLYPGQFVVAWVDTGAYAVRATPNVGRSNAYDVVISTNSKVLGFNCFD